MPDTSRYHRVTVILGDRDADLREWCRANSGACTAVIREALRAWLEANPGAGGGQPMRQQRQPAAKVARPVRPTRTPPTRPDPLPAPSVAEAPDPVSDSVVRMEDESPPRYHEDGQAQPQQDARAKLQRMFDANRDFH